MWHNLSKKILTLLRFQIMYTGIKYKHNTDHKHFRFHESPVMAFAVKKGWCWHCADRSCTLVNNLISLAQSNQNASDNQLFWCTAITWMSISFSMTDRPQESQGTVLDPHILSCSHIFRRRSRTSTGSPPAWTVSPQNRHTIKRKGQVEDWCWTWNKTTIRLVTEML
jgi:hypothetical protein